jgi:thioesterase domain-containing protein
VVADVWARVLFVDDVGLDDDFFELGGDSLAAEALIAAMTGDLGVPGARVTTSVLAQAPTVRSFAARVTREPAGHDVLIPIQTGGALPTLFVVAGGGGLGVAFLRLARHLGPDQPVMALQAHGMERRGVPDWSVRAVARRNIAAMRSMQPRGPYHLAGHSFGGLVAFEMAHQLHRAGQEVGQLIILDSFPPDPELQTVEPALPVPARLKQAIGLALTGIHGAAGSDQYWRFYRLSGVLARRYRSRPWAGDTVVVLAEGPERDVRSRWAGHLDGSWRAVTVAGDHLSMIREPYVAETAEVVAAALGAWRDRHTPGRSPRPVNADP